MSGASIISRLESALPFLSGADRKVGTYVLTNPAEVLGLSSKELASKCGVSEATVTRFARRMDTAGYRDFKIELSASLATSEDVSAIALADISPTDSPSQIHRKLSSYTVSSILKTVEVLDAQELERAVDFIVSAQQGGNRIYLSGLGASSILAQAMRIKLMRLDIPVTYFSDAHLQLESNLNMHEHDLLICFTTLGKSIQTDQAITIARQRHANVILITQYGNHGLMRRADCCLLTASIENNLRLVSQTALVVQLLIVDSLFFSLALRDLSHVRHEVNKTKKEFLKYGYYTS